MKILIATNNKHKVEEISAIFKGTNVELVSPKDIGLSIDVLEDGVTFAENAMKKAEGFRNATGLPVIADDSGLTVEALGGEPGVYSARYGGEGLDDKGRTALLLKNLGNNKNRKAAFVCSIAMILDGDTRIVAEGRCEGDIAFAPSGENGFGYDPVFIPEGFNKSFAELSGEEKNRISHRGRALELLKEKIKGLV